MRFLDEARIFVKSGHGGSGCVSFRREKFIEFGGPDGGNGGRGGHVRAVVDKSLNTLIDFRYRQHFKASTGGHGMGRDRHGRNGKDICLALPLGTQIFNEDKTVLVVDMQSTDAHAILAKGGDGGRGNASFKTSLNRAPRQSGSGHVGEEMWLWLRLKLLADVGLVGLPNAGKSTFLSVISAAKPKIAAYPFSTLHPQLGVRHRDSTSDETVVFADIPGLTEGAHRGIGLGTRFLGHIERCRLLLLLVDAACENPLRDYHNIRQELSLYGSGLSDKPYFVVVSKADCVDNCRRQAISQTLQNIAVPHYWLSSHQGTGIREILSAITQYLHEEHVRV